MALRFLPKRHWQRPLTLWLAAAAALLRAWAEPIAIPNGSFESPSISFVSTNFTAWRKTPKPPTYDETGGFFWDDLTGVFANTPPGTTDHIDNCDGAQALWLFAVPEVGLFQDYDTVDSGHAEPTHAFDAAFQPGVAYQLDFSLIGALLCL